MGRWLQLSSRQEQALALRTGLEVVAGAVAMNERLVRDGCKSRRARSERAAHGCSTSVARRGGPAARQIGSTERRRSRTHRVVGYTTARVLKSRRPRALELVRTPAFGVVKADGHSVCHSRGRFVGSPERRSSPPL